MRLRTVWRIRAVGSSCRPRTGHPVSRGPLRALFDPNMPARFNHCLLGAHQVGHLESIRPEQPEPHFADGLRQRSCPSSAHPFRGRPPPRSWSLDHSLSSCADGPASDDRLRISDAGERAGRSDARQARGRRTRRRPGRAPARPGPRHSGRAASRGR